MIIGIDARPLQSEPRTGVGEFTYELLSHLFEADTANQYVLFSNAMKKTEVYPFAQHPHVSWITTRIPNKLLHASIAVLRYPHLDTYVAKRAGVQKIDVWVSPNLQFTSLSKHVKHILTIHDLSFHHDPSFFSRKGRLWHKKVRPAGQINRANVIVVPSAHTKRDVADVYGCTSDKIVVVSPGGCSHLESAQRHTPQEVIQTYSLPERYLLYIGTLEERKNIEGLLEAYKGSSYLKKHMPLIIAGALGHKGDAYKKRIEQTDGARYIGYVDKFDKYALYLRAHAFVYPSLYEGFGLPVLEAMSVGTPVITSNRTSLPEVVGEAGILVSPNNIKALQTYMENIVHDAVMYGRLKEAALQQSKTFSWDVAVAEYTSLLQNI